MYERSESRIISLEEERSRLEAATKELERSIASANYSPNSAVHRQVRVVMCWVGWVLNGTSTVHGLLFLTLFCPFLLSFNFLASVLCFSYSLSLFLFVSFSNLFVLSFFPFPFLLTFLHYSGLIRTQTLKADPWQWWQGETKRTKKIKKRELALVLF